MGQIARNLKIRYLLEWLYAVGCYYVVDFRQHGESRIY